MSASTLRILGYGAVALSVFAAVDVAEAGLVGGALASFGRSSLVQTVQFGGSNCYYADGWNGRGWYQCGNEWNDGFGWIGPFNLNTFGGPATRRHHPHGVTVFHPQAPTPVFPGYKPPRGLGAAGVRTSPSLHAGAATVTPGFAGSGFHGGVGGGNFHQFHGGGGFPGLGAGSFHGAGSGVSHIGTTVSPGFAGGGGFHGLGGATGIHIGGPVSPSFAGGGGFHGLGGATGVHIGPPVSPGFAGLGGFHAGGGMGAPHIGAPALPGFAGGGFHGVGGGGAFQGGGAALGQGGIGHR